MKRLNIRSIIWDQTEVDHRDRPAEHANEDSEWILPAEAVAIVQAYQTREQGDIKGPSSPDGLIIEAVGTSVIQTAIWKSTGTRTWQR